MIGYFDTSALVPLVVDEPTSERCELLWRAAEAVVVSALAYVEAHAALAQAERLRRIDETTRHDALGHFEELWGQVVAIAPREQVIRRGALLAHAHALRGYDAVHCATILEVDDPDLLVVSGDVRLLDACANEGITTARTAHTDA